jgi:hypothetical protein
MVPHTTFPGDCGLCHVPESWDVLKEGFQFDHEKETGVALLGAHARASCLRCHNDRGPVAAYAERGCGGCHVDPHKSAQGIECARCHNQESWEPIGLVADHARTRFPLVAAHAISPCESCHDRATAGDYRGAPVECHICHRFDAARAVPNHAVGVDWTRDCQRCHTSAGWENRGFQHDFFPLVGGHAGEDCTSCHASGLLLPISPQCFACHRNDYLSAPNHVANQLSTDCTLCHDVFAWQSGG